MSYYLNPFPQHLDSNGNPLAFYVVYFGLPDEDPITNPKDIYADAQFTTPLTNPQTLNNRGAYEQDIFLNGNYSIRIETPLGSLYDATDNYPALLTADEETIIGGVVADMVAAEGIGEGSIFRTLGYVTEGDGGDNFYVARETTAAPDDGGSVIKSIGSPDIEFVGLFYGGQLRMEQFNVNSRDSLNNIIQYSDSSGLEITAGADFSTSFAMATGGRIVLPASAKMNLHKDAVTITADSTFFDDGTAVAMIYGPTASAITDSSISGITCIGGLTDFAVDGISRYGFFIENATNSSVFNCQAQTLERGIFFRQGALNCQVHDNIAYNCFEQGIGIIATTAEPASRCKVYNNYAYCDEGLVSVFRMSGIRTEAVEDSEIYCNTATQCENGIRIEDSGDVSIYNNKSYNNLGVGLEIYITDQRCSIYGNRCWDNNLENNDDTDLTDNKSNANVKFSGISFEALSNNNIVYGNTAFQTTATLVPFTSGSDEPVLGSLLAGASSGETGRVRRIDLDSGTFAGGDATGTMHLVDATGEFDASETIQNITVYLPYENGNTIPRRGDTIEGATSAATGELLWVSQTSGDWFAGTSAGFMYLINTSGAFNGSEVLNNQTTGDNAIADNNAAETPIDLDIALTDGATTLGESKGFQKYGICLNPANRTGVGTGPAYNIISNNQVFNNDLNDIEDRGYYNNVNNNNTFYVTITKETS